MTHIPDVTLERYRLGELDADELARIARLSEEDYSLKRRLNDLARSDLEIEGEYAGDLLAQQVRSRRSRVPEVREVSWATRLGWAVPALLILTMIVLAHRYDVLSIAEGDRAKGTEAALVVYRNGAAGAELLRDNDVVRASDIIRVGYRVSEPQYGLILSIDGRGTITRHLPADGDAAVALRAGTPVLLDSAFELDDAPLIERFFLITAPSPFDAAPVLDALRRASAARANEFPNLALRSPFNVVTFSLRKDSRP